MGNSPTFAAEWDVVKWAFKMAWKINKRNMIFWTILNVLGALTPVFVLKLTERLVNSITSTFTAAEGLALIGWQIGALVLLWILQSSYNIIPQIVRYTMQTRYSIAMQEKYALCVNRVPLSKFDEKEFSAKISHVGSTCSRLAYFVGGLTALVGTLIGISGLLWLAFSTSWIFLVIALIAVVLISTLSASVIQSNSDFWDIAKLERRKQQYYADLLTGRESGREIRAMGTAGFFKTKWRSLLERLTGMEVDLSLKNRRIYNSLALLQIVFSLIILGVGVALLWHGKIQLGALVMLGQLSSQLFGAIQSLANDFHYPLSYLPVLKEQKEVFEMVFDETGLPSREAKQVVPANPKVIYRLQDVSFGYNPEKSVLKSITFTINRGETVALVGDNGAGKSTLIKLLLGLYVPDSGSIWFEGLPYDHLSQEYLYGKTGVVFQDFKQYPFTIRENIAFGDISQLHNDGVLLQAAAKGQAEKIIKSQPLGLDTYLGREYVEDGLALSGGEWQRIGVARAHVSDKEILILDEPAAKLDPVAEMEQFMAIKHSLGGRTAVLVSHRLGFARLADKIIVLSEGEMVEIGTHQELMKAGGHYATMFKAQAEWYEGGVAASGT